MSYSTFGKKSSIKRKKNRLFVRVVFVKRLKVSILDLHIYYIRHTAHLALSVFVINQLENTVVIEVCDTATRGVRFAELHFLSVAKQQGE